LHKRGGGNKGKKWSLKIVGVVRGGTLRVRLKVRAKKPKPEKPDHPSNQGDQGKRKGESLASTRPGKKPFKPRGKNGVRQSKTKPSEEVLHTND